MNKLLSLILLLACVSLSAQSKKMDPVKWSFDSNQVGPNEFELIFRADFKSPWVVYSMKTPEGGPIPTSLNFTSDNVKPVGNAKEKGEKKEAMDKMFDTNVIKFKSGQPYIIKQTVMVEDISKPVTGYVTFMACNNEYCLPPTDVDFSFTYKVNEIKTIDKGAKIPIKNF